VPSPRQTAQDRYNTARSSLILLILLTVVNLVLYVIEADRMLLFSATVPYFAVALGISLNNIIALVICSGVAALTLISYLICWIASKKNNVWLIVALVLFVIDTLGLVGICLINGEITMGIPNFVIHIWIIVELVIGVVNGRKLKRFPEYADVEEESVSETAESAENVSAE